MTTFTIFLQSSTQFEKIQDVMSFVGEDSSGQFGLLVNHARIMTCLCFGICYFRYENDKIDYLALPGGILYFINNQLLISTTYYLRSQDYQLLELAIDNELRVAEENISSIKESLQHLDEAFLKHLWELKRQGHYEI